MSDNLTWNSKSNYNLLTDEKYFLEYFALSVAFLQKLDLYLRWKYPYSWISFGFLNHILENLLPTLT